MHSRVLRNISIFLEMIQGLFRTIFAKQNTAGYLIPHKWAIKEEEINRKLLLYSMWSSKFVLNSWKLVLQKIKIDKFVCKIVW